MILMRSKIRARGRSFPRWVAAGLAVGVAATLAANLWCAGALEAQSPPPDGEWRTFETEHFRVTFQPALEWLARRAGHVAERTHAVLREELTRAPDGPIELVVTDHVDITNGFARPFPSNRIVVFARPPLDLPQLAYTRDWIELVVAHELVHVFHMDITGPVGGAIRKVLGRVPMVWPLFPVVGTPAWSIEGLATHYESRLTGAGRVHGSFHDMVVRMAALDGGIPELDAVSAPSPVWPGGLRSYVYGASFMRWIAQRYGNEAHARLLDATATAGLPPFLFFDPVAREVTGRSFDGLYEEWRHGARARADSIRRVVEDAGVTPSEVVVGARTGTADAAGPFAVAPRVSPDGARLVFAADDFRSKPATRVVWLSTGETRTLAERNQGSTLLGPASWLPDGTALITAQLEFADPYRIHSDLWHVNLGGEERRLTHGARLAQPDVARDGRRVAAVQGHEGGLRLVVYDFARGTGQVLAEALPGEGFAGPRWSPDGRTVAAARLRNGRVDLVLVDVASGQATAITRDDALDYAPAWSPDGRWILFWSDRSGIPNLYAASPAADGTVRQVTNVVGGAFDPDVSPDGRWIYYSAYGAHGWRIERMPFDTTGWRAAPASSLAYGPALLDSVEVAPAPAEAPVRPYSAWPSVRPHFWIPDYRNPSAAPDQLHFLGAYSVGSDVLERHRWEAMAAVDPGSGRFLGNVDWTWRGFGVPALTLSLGRDWSGAGSTVDAETGGPEEGIWLREDVASLDALFLRARWRGTSWLTAGADLRTRDYDLHRGGAEGDAILEAAGVPELPTLLGLQTGVGWRTARSYPYSISLQDGISASLGVTRWWEIDGLDRSHDQLQGRIAGYLGVPSDAFADHVLAARVSALARFGEGSVPTSIGGAGGSPETLLNGAALGGRALFLPVRGYRDGARIGTRAWTASAEYRIPLHLAGWRGGDLLGLSITALSGTLFGDAGDAWCAQSLPGCRTAPGDPLLSAGAELALDFGVLHSVPLRVRGGFAVPFTDLNPDDGRAAVDPRNWRLHLAFGSSF